MKRLVVFTVLLSATVTVLGQTAPDKDAIEAVVAGETAAWNAHNAKAFAAHFTPDGSFTNIVGMSTYGRPPFEKQHEKIFATIYKDSIASFTIDRLKMIRPDIALVDVNGSVRGYSELPPGIPPPADGVLRTKLQMTLVKEQGSWWIASFHNVVVIPLPAHP